MRLLLLLFVLIDSSATAQSDRAPYSGSPRTSEQVSAGHLLWQLDIRRNEPVKDFLGPRVVYSSGWLLAIANSGKVVALEPQTGRVRWSRMGAGIIYAVDDKSLYIAEEEGLLALDLETGRTRWTTDETYISPYEPLTVSKNHIFIPKPVADAISAAVYIYDARTGKRLGEASSRGPLAIIDRQAFFRNDWFLIDYPDDVYIDVHDLQTGKRLESRTYSVENRVRGQDWNSKVAVAGAVYISGGGNIACFPPAQPGGKAKPNFIQVPRGDVQWLAGPHNGTFLLEWQGALWTVKQQQKPCTPMILQKRGFGLTAGKLARTDVMKNGMYIGFKNGTFYAVDTRTGQVLLKLALRNYAPGPTHVVGNTLVIQAGNKLLAFALPEELKH